MEEAKRKEVFAVSRNLNIYMAEWQLSGKFAKRNKMET